MRLPPVVPHYLPGANYGSWEMEHVALSCLFEVTGLFAATLPQRGLMMQQCTPGLSWLRHDVRIVARRGGTSHFLKLCHSAWPFQQLGHMMTILACWIPLQWGMQGSSREPWGHARDATHSGAAGRAQWCGLHSMRKGCDMHAVCMFMHQQAVEGLCFRWASVELQLQASEEGKGVPCRAEMLSRCTVKGRQIASCKTTKARDDQVVWLLDMAFEP